MNVTGRWRSFNKEKQLWIVFLGSCLLLELFFIPRAFRGFNTSDEMFFVGTVDRLFRGDRLLIDEWQPAQQLSAFWIYPFYWVIRSIFGSTEGIILAYRMLGLAFHLLTACVIFQRLKKKGWGGFLAALLFLVYAPFGIFTLSYNSIQLGVLPLLLACLYGKEHHRKWEYVIYGVLCALLVLANPFSVLLYGLYGCVCAAGWVRKKVTGREVTEILQIRSFLLFTLGAAIMAVLFAAFVLSRGTIGEVLENLPNILSDAEHPQEGLATYVEKVKRYFYLCHKSYKYLIYGFGALYLAIGLDKKRNAHAAVYLVLGAGCVIPYLIYYGFVFEHITVNYQMMPLAFFGLEAYLLTKAGDKRLFCFGFVPAVIYTMIVQLSSNTGIVTISAAYGIASILSVVFLWDCGREICVKDADGVPAGRLKSFKTGKTVAAGVLLLVLVMQFAGTGYLRMTYAWGDDVMENLTVKMERGPLKGVYTNPDMAEHYEEVLKELDSLALTEEDKLLVVGVAPWIYLYTDAQCGSYSTWQIHENSLFLFTYYELHPDKIPNVIYMNQWGEDFLNSVMAKPFYNMGYEVTYLERGIVMQAPGRMEAK